MPTPDLCARCGALAVQYGQAGMTGFICLPRLPPSSRASFQLPAGGSFNLCMACRNSTGEVANEAMERAGWITPKATKQSMPAKFNQQKSVKDSLLYPIPTEQCLSPNDPVRDGVFVWTESSGAGHAFLSLHRQGKITIYTYGRYGDQKDGFPLVGEGILLRMPDNSAAYGYMKKELYEWGAKVFKILDADIDIIDGYMSGIYLSSERYPQPETSKADTVRFGRVVDVYDLTGNNCTTYTVRGIKSSGSRVLDSSTLGIGYSEDFTIPGSLQKHLVAASSDSSNMSVIEVTQQVKTWVANVDSITQRPEGGTAKVERSSADSSGTSGGSSGYAGGTVGGVLGGSYE